MKRWEFFQRKSGKEAAGLGTRPMPTLRIGTGGPEPKFGDTPKAHGLARSHVKRVPLPYFSGKAEELPEFRRYFRELTVHKQFPPASRRPK